MKRSLLIAVVVASIVAPAGAAPTALPAQADDALAIADHVRDMAARFPRGASIAEQLAAAARIGHHDLPEARLVDTDLAGASSFADAMLALYQAAGVEPVAVTPPAPAVATAVAPLITAIARGIELTDVALARLTPKERRWAARHVDLFEMPWSAAAGRLADIVARVDMSAMNRAATTIAAAIDALPDGLPVASSWVDPTGAVEIGGTGDDSYTTDRVLLLDLGGNDQHLDAAGAIGPAITNTLGVPVSISVDLGGDDYYLASTPNQAENTLVAQGVGIGGIGLLVDRWGNDIYQAGLTGIFPHPCVGDPVFGGFPGRFPQIVHAQGAGAFGVGALIDLSGTDYSWAASYAYTPTNCHFVRNAVHAQGAGLQRGVGVLIDDLGNDYRSIDTYTTGLPGYPGAQDFISGSHGQGFGAGGAGLLVDKEGSDYNHANAYAQWSYANANKGAFATTFVQGSVAGLIRDYSVTPPLPDIPPAAPGTPCIGLSSGQGDPGGGGGGGERSSRQCQLAGVGVHVDVLGNDTFHAGASSIQGAVNLCTVGSVALVGAQGSAAWGGLGALANLDAEGYDSFSMTPYATGGPCFSDNTRAIAAGQGFGGSVRYPIWDDPESWYAGVDQYSNFNAAGGVQARLSVPAVGVLVSAGAPCPPGQPKVGSDVAVPCTQDLQGPTSSPDSYTSIPVAFNQQATAIAESWAQGSGGRPRPNFTAIYSPVPAPVPALPWAMGIGVLADVGGSDAHYSTPYATGGQGTTSKSVAQGATEGGIGALINLFGDDLYHSLASGGAASSLHQGDARAGFGESFTPIAALVDVGGSDTYGPAVTCQGNGGLPGWLLWGNLGTCGAQPGTLIIGLDAGSGVGM